MHTDPLAAVRRAHASAPPSRWARPAGLVIAALINGALWQAIAALPFPTSGVALVLAAASYGAAVALALTAVLTRPTGGDARRRIPPASRAPISTPARRAAGVAEAHLVPSARD